MDKEKIIKCLEKHLRWVNDEEGGEKANLSEADLRWANLSGANLIRANLSDSDLSGANLIRANLSGANLSEADLRWANLSGANLSGANLSGANLSVANLREANLRVFHGGKWIAFIDPKSIRIGCKFFSVSEWNGFSDEEISEMDCDALEFWKENKAVIMTIAKQLQEQFQVKEAE